MAARERVLAGDASKGGGLARAIGAYQGHALARQHLKAHAVHRTDTVKVLDQLLDLQHQRRSSRLEKPGSRPTSPIKPEGDATMISMMKTPSSPRQ